MSTTHTLALDGGPPARTRFSPPMYPGASVMGAEEEAAVLDVIRSKRLFRYYGMNDGPSRVSELEEAFAARLGTAHAATVTSGTAALVCALVGLGVGPGDEVIVPAYTWIACACAVTAVGAVPILAEIDESLCLCPEDVERKITKRTRAIMPVHVSGGPADLDALLAIAQRHGVRLVEDCAQANGGSWKGKPLGSVGHVGAFSFQYNKLITAGECGMVTTSDPEIHNRVLMYQDPMGGLRNGVPPNEIMPGVNLRMPELLAAVLLAQLAKLDGLVGAIRAQARALREGTAERLRAAGGVLRKTNDADGDNGVAHVMMFRTVAQAEWVSRALAAERVSAGQLHSDTSFDFHVYSQWGAILAQRTWTPAGGPWRWSAPVEYRPDMCPRTLDILSRSVYFAVNPVHEASEVDETIHGINKVLGALPGRVG